MSKTYKLTDDELSDLQKAARFPVISGWANPGNETAASKSEDIWNEVARRLGIDMMTIKPSGDDPRCFTAEPIVEVEEEKE